MTKHHTQLKQAALQIPLAGTTTTLVDNPLLLKIQQKRALYVAKIIFV
jgi:hypothetical protein